MKRESIVGCKAARNAQSQRPDESVHRQAQPSAEGVSTPVLPSEAPMAASNSQSIDETSAHKSNEQHHQDIDNALANEFVNQDNLNS